MNILKIPSLDPGKYNEYLKLLNEWTIILNWWKIASMSFDKWLKNKDINNIIYRWWYNQKSQFVDYYFFYKENQDKDDYDESVKALIQENI